MEEGFSTKEETVDKQSEVVIAEDNIDLMKEDRHTPHNTMIVMNVNEAIKKLKKTDKKKYKRETIIEEIQKELCGEDMNEQIGLIMEQIKDLQRDIYEENEFVDDELEILRLVWERINYEKNEMNIDNLTHNLKLALMECMDENDGQVSVMCREGRISRYVQIFEQSDFEKDIVVLKPLWIYKEEIGHIITENMDNYLKQNKVFEKLFNMNENEMTQNRKKRYNKYLKQILTQIDKYIDEMYKHIINEKELKHIKELFYNEYRIIHNDTGISITGGESP